MATRELTHEDMAAGCAQRMGMKVREILAVVPMADGDWVQTHDQQWTLLLPDGGMVFHGATGPDTRPLDEPDVEPEPAAKPAPAKPAPAKKSTAAKKG